jgi:hypothetical protein
LKKTTLYGMIYMETFANEGWIPASAGMTIEQWIQNTKLLEDA